MLCSRISDKIIYMEHRDGFVKHQINSFGYAIEGLVYSFQKGLHFRIHILAFALVSVLGFIFSISLLEWLAVILISSAVIAAEALNTAIEETCNLLHPDLHPKAKLAKHCAAGGVLILSIAAVIIGLLIFIPKIFG
ncbi:MAG: putative Diacylglycerol kinase [Candidatus Curtissbacteria bacterium GW2011_GWA1_40_47]|nr:MAG: putative Diacylglycerol kinase [Candidatus Curtissbacteria bacterium GW2011_GWB1_40_28]KKR60860.1 MAG: putative Diacylglycerol kinase [Candidatus Curtissbacteria bacterium GW2011_GWA2_40_31]KKR62168.1 MAG: putative Diacylglycerol kinase [Microgenomates group bacterium GW2011_GWC1_40_35]KKR66043.1 MAG: putative Diacylglycerol kinase [Candidatus Curtissbacteria bacterium GW2011_GWA1_40_47]KKR77709.1 MAG: putative Diacylglycerol kinase [Candidatus Curtissbacteria bacterium GW2011_GWD1_40_8